MQKLYICNMFYSIYINGHFRLSNCLDVPVPTVTLPDIINLHETRANPTIIPYIK